ncbi:MAG: hypothetical protein AAGD43_11805 [Pseudomonadota bacterium]
MSGEIDEATASGEIARIFTEVRELWGVPYVSAIHRFMAAQPGLLEWSWAAVAPAFHSGLAQQAAAKCAEGLELGTIEPIPSEVLAAWRMSRDDQQAVLDICASFIRVSPINMMFAGLTATLLTETAVPPTASADKVASPAMLPPLPDMVDLTALPQGEHDALYLFASDMVGQPFVPGLYRMLAHWPSLMMHLAVVLPPRLSDDRSVAAYDELRARIDAAVPGVRAMLPPEPAQPQRPSDEASQHFLEIIKTYRKTSPEMVVASTIIRAAMIGSRS